MTQPRYRVLVSGPVGRAVVQWLYELIPLLRRAPKNVKVTVELQEEED
jgi:hypothetical protein